MSFNRSIAIVICFFICVFVWYDFFIVIDLLPILKKHYFFNIHDAVSKFLFLLSQYGTIFISIPLGAIYGGKLCDTIGRKKMIVKSTLISGLSGLVMGYLPSMADFGLLIPIVLILLRLIQGFYLIIAFSACFSYISEFNMNKKTKTPFLNIIIATPLIGFAVSKFIISLISTSHDYGYTVDYFSGFPIDNFSVLWGGWRFTFLPLALLILLAILVYIYFVETEEFFFFKRNNNIFSNPFKILFDKNHIGVFFTTLFALFFSMVSILYLVQYYLPKYLTKVCHINIDDTNSILITAIMISIPCFPIFAWVSNQVGRKFILLMGLVFSIFVFHFIMNDMKEITTLERKMELLDLQEQQIKNKKNKITGNVLRRITNFNTYDNGSVKTTIKYDTVIAQTRQILFDKNPKVEIKVGAPLYWQLVILVFLPLVLLAMFTGPMIIIFNEKYFANIKVSAFAMQFQLAFAFIVLMLEIVPKILVSLKIIKYEGQITFSVFLFIISFIISSVVAYKFLQLKKRQVHLADDDLT